MYSIFFYKKNVPMWFIFALMIFALAMPIFDCIVKKKRLGLVLIITLAIIETSFDLIKLPPMLYFESESIVYYLVGCFIGKHYFREFTKNSSVKTYIIASVLFVIITIYKLFTAYNLLNFLNVADIFIMIIYALSFWFMVDAFVYKITIKPYMKNSFFIYMTHVNISAIIIKLFYLAFPKGPLMSIVNFVMSALITIVAICILCNVLGKLMPKTYKILSGDR